MERLALAFDRVLYAVILLMEPGDVRLWLARVALTTKRGVDPKRRRLNDRRGKEGQLQLRRYVQFFTATIVVDDR
jgi:hypothetical protein